jgi:NarL family two-component system response regulator LiaR
MARDLRPDVILMDMMMPKTSGVEATARILQGQPEARVLILTSFGSDENVGQALRAGAMGLLPKESQPGDLLNAIRSVYRGQLTIPQHAARALAMQGVPPKSSELPLTEREEDVLTALARGLSNQQIAEHLGIGANTVRTHVGNLLRKLELSNRTELAIYAIKRSSRA